MGEADDRERYSFDQLAAIGVTSESAAAHFAAVFRGLKDHWKAGRLLPAQIAAEVNDREWATVLEAIGWGQPDIEVAVAWRPAPSSRAGLDSWREGITAWAHLGFTMADWALHYRHLEELANWIGDPAEATRTLGSALVYDRATRADL